MDNPRMRRRLRSGPGTLDGVSQDPKSASNLFTPFTLLISHQGTTVAGRFIAAEVKALSEKREIPEQHCSVSLLVDLFLLLSSPYLFILLSIPCFPETRKPR